MMGKLKFILMIFYLNSMLFSGRWYFLGFENEKINAVAVHPSNPDIILVSGNQLYRSEDAGVTWDTVSILAPNFILFHPEYPETVYFTMGIGSWSDGIYRSFDCGNTWEILYFKLYANSIAISLYPEAIIIGSHGEGVERSDDGGITWYPMNDSLDNMNVLSLFCINFSDSTLYFLAGTEGGIYHYSTDHWVNTNTPDNIGAFAINAYRSYSSVIWCVLNGNGSYSDGIYKSVDYGYTWEISEWIVYPGDILVNSLDSQIVYCADSGYGVLITRDEGNTWNFMNEFLEDSTVICLAQSKSDTMYLYAGTESGLYRYEFGTGVNERINRHEFLKFKDTPYRIYYRVPAEFSGSIFEINFYDISGRLMKKIMKKADKGWNYLDLKKFLKKGVFVLEFQIEKLRVLKKLISIE